MSFTSDLLEKAPGLSTVSKYTIVNGLIYFATGAMLVVWPGAVQTIFQEAAFAGHEEGLLRVIGLTVGVIGWLYIFGGRTGARSFVAASVIDRLVFVPAVLVPLALSGLFPRLLLAFTALDAALAIGALILRNRVPD
jgi:hypothetical protein